MCSPVIRAQGTPMGRSGAEGLKPNPEGGEKHGEDAAEAAKTGASMALANNTKVIGPQVDRGGKMTVYSRPCRRGGMIVRLPQDPSRSGVGKGASCGT